MSDSFGFQIVDGTWVGQSRMPRRYSERTTMTWSGPSAIDGSTDAVTQRAPARERRLARCVARLCWIGPPMPSVTTTNSSRRPCGSATSASTWSSCDESSRALPGAKLNAIIWSARFGLSRASLAACSAVGSPQAERASAASTRRGIVFIVVLLLEREAGRGSGILLATDRQPLRRRRMVEALHDEAVGIGRRNAAAHRRLQPAAGRLDEVGRDDDHQLGLLTLVGVRLEKRAEHWDIAQPRHLPDVILALPHQQAGDREALAAAELDGRRGTSRLHGGNRHR